jgi:hypothetical protein
MYMSKCGIGRRGESNPLTSVPQETEGTHLVWLPNIKLMLQRMGDHKPKYYEVMEILPGTYR